MLAIQMIANHEGDGRRRRNVDARWIFAMGVLREPRCSGRLLGAEVHDVFLLAGEMSLLLNLREVDVGNGVVAVKDASNLLEGRALCLDVEEVHEDELEEVPEGVEEHKVPVLGKVVPRELVGLTVDNVSWCYPEYVHGGVQLTFQ